MTNTKTMKRTVTDDEFVAWWALQERRPTVRQAAAWLVCSSSSAYMRIIRLAAEGRIDRRTADEKWAE